MPDTFDGIPEDSHKSYPCDCDCDGDITQMDNGEWECDICGYRPSEHVEQEDKNNE